MFRLTGLLCAAVMALSFAFVGGCGKDKKEDDGKLTCADAAKNYAKHYRARKELLLEKMTPEIQEKYKAKLDTRISKRANSFQRKCEKSSPTQEGLKCVTEAKSEEAVFKCIAKEKKG